MALEDRGITTEQLVEANSGEESYLQLGSGVLRRLDPLGMHVLVPSGPLPGSEVEPVLCCQAHLRVTEEEEPLVVPTMVSIDGFLTLPTPFEALGIGRGAGAGHGGRIEVWASGS